MKKLIYPLLSIALLMAPACSKKSDPDPVPTPPAPTGPVASYSLTSAAAAPVTCSMNVNDYGDATDAGGLRVSRAIIDVNLSGGTTARIKYYLTASQPMGAVRSVTVQPLGSSSYGGAAAGTLTGRLVGAGANAHLYLSGAFTADMGPGLAGASGKFTDLQAY